MAERVENYFLKILLYPKDHSAEVTDIGCVRLGEGVDEDERKGGKPFITVMP